MQKIQISGAGQIIVKEFKEFIDNNAVGGGG